MRGLRTTLLFRNWSSPLYFKTVYFPALGTSLKHYLTFSFRDGSLWISIFRWIQCDLYQLLQIGSEGTFMCQFYLFLLQTERKGWRVWGERALPIKQTLGEQKTKSHQSHTFWPETRVPHPSTITISLTSITDADQTHVWESYIHTQMCSLHCLGVTSLGHSPQDHKWQPASCGEAGPNWVCKKETWASLRSDGVTPEPLFSRLKDFNSISLSS